MFGGFVVAVEIPDSESVFVLIVVDYGNVPKDVPYFFFVKFY